MSAPAPGGKLGGDMVSILVSEPMGQGAQPLARAAAKACSLLKKGEGHIVHREYEGLFKPHAA